MSSKKQLTPKEFFEKPNVNKRFEEMLGNKAPGFISSILQLVTNNTILAKANPMSVYAAAATAAALDLPVNQSLGFAWIVPYKGQAQFQIGWKGLVQLALRTGQYKRINVVKVYENQFKSYNALTEQLEADFKVIGTGKIAGYVAYFQLINGFEKLVFWTIEEVKTHAKKYSQTYGKINRYGKLVHSPWNDETQFDAMAMKTVLKNTISKWGIMSIQIQNAVIFDQSVQKQEGKAEYPDNETIDLDAIDQDKERNRILKHINESTTLEELIKVRGFVSEYDLATEYEDKENELATNNQ